MVTGSCAGFRRIGLWFRIIVYLPDTFARIDFQPGKAHSAVNVGTEINHYRTAEFVKIIPTTVNYILSDLDAIHQYPVDRRRTDMLSHMLGKLIILFFLKLLIAERSCCFQQFTGKRFKQKVYES